MGTVHHLPLRLVSNVREPTRQDDERLLRVAQAFEQSGIRVLEEEPDMQRLDDGAAALAAKFQATSPYLNRPLRTEEDVRARREPRMPRARGLLELIAEQTGIDRAFAKLIGRDHD